MGLEEQITRAGHYSLIIKEEVDAITQIAENFAIGFSEWTSRQSLNILQKGIYWSIELEKRITIEELLEIYKKTL
jgi:dissimilatory sulfite reductase (desulfoviridin) alpha/beta subunit